MKAVCLLLIAVCGACAEATPEPVMMTPAEPFEMQMARAPEPARPVSRPRLAQTITLGTGAYTEPSAPAAEEPSAPAPSQPPVTYGVYGGYYGYDYGYGGYGGGFGRGNTGAATNNPASSNAARAPAVGGDWPAVPSYGPKPMR